MTAYEFETEIKSGIIEIPKDLKGIKPGKFKVIIVTQETKQDKLRQALLHAPVWTAPDVQNFNNTVRKGYINRRL